MGQKIIRSCFEKQYQLLHTIDNSENDSSFHEKVGNNVENLNYSNTADDFEFYDIYLQQSLNTPEHEHDFEKLFEYSSNKLALSDSDDDLSDSDSYYSFPDDEPYNDIKNDIDGEDDCELDDDLNDCSLMFNDINNLFFEETLHNNTAVKVVDAVLSVTDFYLKNKLRAFSVEAFVSSSYKPFSNVKSEEINSELNVTIEPEKLKLAIENLHLESDNETRCQIMEKIVQIIIEDEIDYIMIPTLAFYLSSTLSIQIYHFVFPENNMNDEALADSISRPLFVMFRNNFQLCKEEDVRRKLLARVLAEIQLIEPKIGYLLLYFLQVWAMKKKNVKLNNPIFLMI